MWQKNEGYSYSRCSTYPHPHCFYTASVQCKTPAIGLLTIRKIIFTELAYEKIITRAGRFFINVFCRYESYGYKIWTTWIWLNNTFMEMNCTTFSRLVYRPTISHLDICYHNAFYSTVKLIIIIFARLS